MLLLPNLVMLQTETLDFWSMLFVESHLGEREEREEKMLEKGGKNVREERKKC